ncbi:MAG: tRNA pseudouridine(55) synthase TruB [Planctomycetes bacterium]|nr:tRNA pseudouridine(55) synthase TruB [Planctomycetota bacterium]
MDQPFPDTLAAFKRDPLALCWRIPGLWPVAKPSGPSSNLMVVRARRALGLKRIGHAGTLDPLASGLLLLLAGNATRLFDHLQEFPKRYRAGFRCGQRTDSQDITGQALADWQPSQPPPDAAAFRPALEAFRGDILQTPPMFSALKRDGTPLYRLARAGATVDRPARPARVDALELTAYDGEAGELTMTVSSGFYVRTLIDDLGLALGCGAVMTSLVRTGIGPFRLEDAKSLDDLPALQAGIEDGPSGT